MSPLCDNKLEATISSKTAPPLSTRSSTNQSTIPYVGLRSSGSNALESPGDSRSKSRTNTFLPSSASAWAVTANAVERPTPPLIEKKTIRGDIPGAEGTLRLHSTPETTRSTHVISRSPASSTKVGNPFFTASRCCSNKITLSALTT